VGKLEFTKLVEARDLPDIEEYFGCKCPKTGKLKYRLELEWVCLEESPDISLTCNECGVYVDLHNYLESGGAIYTETSIPVSVTWSDTYGGNYFDPYDGELFAVIEAEND
jgi:hypothetical protein